MKRALLLGVASVALLSSSVLANDRNSAFDRGSFPTPRALHSDYHEDAYQVLYRAGHEHHWHEQGIYRGHEAAHHVAHDLEHQGFEVRVERI